MSNNILFGDTSYYTSYIQAFLRDNYSMNVLPTNKYDKQTHQALIKYLNQPNVSVMFDVETKLKETYEDLTTKFNLLVQNDELIFVSKVIDTETADFIKDNMESIKELVLSMGWELSYFNDYINYDYDINGDGKVDIVDKTLVQTYITTKRGLTEEQKEKADINFDGIIDSQDLNLLSQYIDRNKLVLRFKAQDRKNYFPNKDMLNFINLFNNDFYFYKAIRDGKGNDDRVHDGDGSVKICIVECKPGTTYTIAHSSAKVQRLVIGSMVTNKRNIKVSNLQNVLDVNVPPGEPILYTTSKRVDSDRMSRDAQYMLIQCSSNIEDYSNLEEKKELLALGNVNLDYYKDENGHDIKSRPKIDAIDRKLLADYIYYPEEDPRRPVFTDKQKAAADINLDGVIDGNDLQMLVDYLEGRIVTLGTIEYKYYVPKEIDQLNNVASLLIMEGNTIEEPTGETKSTKIAIQHDELTDILNTVDNTFTESDYGNAEIEITNPSTQTYDRIKFVSSFTRIEGNAIQSPGAISLATPRQIKICSDFSILVNGTEAIDNDLSDSKLVKINDIADYIYQSQNKYIYHKSIGEEFSSSLQWERVETTVSGKYYIRTKQPTSFIKAGDDLTVAPNLMCNKLNTVSPYQIMSCTCPYDECISVDKNGRIIVYVKNWETLQINDILYWLRMNPFYVYGELQQYSETAISEEITDIELIEGNNTLVFSSLNSIVPSKVQMKTKALGITNAWLEEITSTFTVTKSTIGVNFNTFTTDPWIVHSKFMAYLLGQAITPYSRSEDITYAQNLIRELYPLYDESFIPGIYSDLLKDLIEQYQRTKVSYGKGDLNKDNKINETDTTMLSEYLNGERELSEAQLKLADVDGDTKVTVNDLNIMRKEVDGINDNLKVFEIPFLMGYIDPTTEYRMLKEISHKEVGRLNHREIGW